MTENPIGNKQPDINTVATQYLRELLTGIQIKRSDLVVEHVCSKSRESRPGEHAQSASEFLEIVKQQFAAVPEPEQERIEVEESGVILTWGARFFLGFLRGSRVVFGFDARLSLELSCKQADKVQPALALLGYETHRLPSLPKAEASF
jgi:hypothetical protein